MHESFAGLLRSLHIATGARHVLLDEARSLSERRRSHVLLIARGLFQLRVSFREELFEAGPENRAAFGGTLSD